MPAAGARSHGAASERRSGIRGRDKPPRSSARRTKVRTEKNVKNRTAAKSKKRSLKGSKSTPQVNVENAQICPICHEPYGASTIPVVHAPCGHVACASCSIQWQERKNSRACALCRTPILSLAHCHMLEQLLRKQSPDTDSKTAENAGAEASSSSVNHAAERVELKKALQTLSQGDLNNLPGDSRSYVVRCMTERFVRKGDLTMLRRCLEHYKTRPSTKLFCDIASFWKEEPKAVLSMMLAHGAKIDGHRADRPLMSAVSQGNLKMVSALLEVKADATKTAGSYNETALHVAARYGQYGAARMLLDHGALPNIPDSAQRTPLFMAEKGLEMHLESCMERPCKRCEARIQLRGELRFRTDYPNSAASMEPASPGTSESSDSSSLWESSSEVSDVGEWLEEEDDEGHEEAGEDDEEADDDPDEMREDDE